MTNLDEFDEAAAWLLAELYGSFPRRKPFRFDRLFGEDEARIELYAGTLVFLRDEGFVRYESRSSNICFECVALTAKGLEILNAKPKAIEAKVTLGQRIKSAVAEGAKEAYRTLIQQVVSGIVGRG